MKLGRDVLGGIPEDPNNKPKAGASLSLDSAPPQVADTKLAEPQTQSAKKTS